METDENAERMVVTYCLIGDLVASCYHSCVNQLVKLSDELVLDARLTAEVAERSIAGQIEADGTRTVGRFVNRQFKAADVLARELSLDPYPAADLANSLRRDFVKRGESFVFETVFSDPASEKLKSRFPRTMCNLAAATGELPHVLIFDNSDLNTPFRQVAVFEHGKLAFSNAPFPEWLQPVLG